jgi:hypothetical protein
MFPFRYKRCDECGASVEQSRKEDHRCEPELLIEREVFRMHAAIARVEDDFIAYLHTSRGRFEAWLAERQVSAHGLE